MSAMANFWPKLPPPDAASDADTDSDTDDGAVALDAPAPRGKKPPPEKPKAYVHIEKVGVSETFDDKYKDTLPPIMVASLVAAVDGSAKLTTTEAAKGFYLDGNLALKRTDIGVKASLTMQMATWPDKSMFGFPTGTVSVEVSNPKRIDGDVDAAVRALMVKIQATIIPEFERRA